MNACKREGPAQVEKYYGKYPGLVLKNGPQSGSPHRGELVVQVQGILEESPDGLGQRPIEVLAKPCFLAGFFFIPKEKDTVWVEFAAGEIDSPLWTGVWYPTDLTPKTTDGNSPTVFQKVIRTASGQVIQLDDSDGSETLIISDEKNGNVITLNAEGITIESTDKTISITCKEMKITGEVTVEGKVHLTDNTDIDKTLTVGTGPKTTIQANEISGG